MLFRRAESAESEKPSVLVDVLGPKFGTAAIFLLEVFQIIVISIAIIVPVRVFLIQPFIVRGASMEPNFYDREYLVIDEISYRFREPVRGDIVVFRYPRDPSQYFIKRVIGLPGETVEIENGQVKIVNDAHPLGDVLAEPYLDGEQTIGTKRFVLNPDEYVVLGDNRDYSLDSRAFGPITKDEIVGRVWVRGLPLSRIGTFDSVSYNL